MVKGFLVQVQEYIDDIAYYEKHKEELDKEMGKNKEANKENECNVPEGFGKPQPNADEFKTVSFTVKKKRTHQEAMGTSKDATVTSTLEDKRPKLENQEAQV